jgi:ribosomal protein S18 acetylase RimI-like enzyme
MTAPEVTAPAAKAESQRVQISIPESCAADDVALVARLTDLINAVYTETEEGLFAPSYRRTSHGEVRQLLVRRELALASIHLVSPPSHSDPEKIEPAVSDTKTVIGCIRIVSLSPTHGDFAMLACDAAYRGRGAGRALVRFAEEHCRAVLGKTAMQCELLVSRAFDHPFKARNQAWYERMGYRVVGRLDFATEHPHLAGHLVTEGELRVFEKALLV